MLTHRNLAENAGSINMDLPERMVLLSVLPIHHAYCLCLDVLKAISLGSIICINDSLLRVMKNIQLFKPEMILMVPLMIETIAKKLEDNTLLPPKLVKNAVFGKQLTKISSGGAYLDPSYIDLFEKYGITILQGYGMTECSPVISTTRPWNINKKAVGQLIDNCEAKTVDGELWVRGSSVMQGYYNMPKDTAEAIDEEGWLHSGDLGIMDEDGYVSISGRIKDMIIRGGENVYPREVEEFLLKMDGVADVQVVAVPSRRYGEEVGAFLIPKEGADVAPEDVRDYCRGKIAWYKIPRYVAVVEGFPLTASGKIQKYKLREMAAAYFPEAMRERNGLPSRGRRGTA